MKMLEGLLEATAEMAREWQEEHADETEAEFIERVLSTCRESQEIMPLSVPADGDPGDPMHFYTFTDDFIFFIEDCYKRQPEKFEVGNGD